MSIEKTPHGTWRARWRDDAGRPQSKTFKRRTDAVAFERDTLADLQRGLYIDHRAAGMTVATWADRWLASAHNLGPGGHDTYRRDLDRHLLPATITLAGAEVAVGALPLRKVTPAVIDAYLVTKAHLAPSTRHRHYRIWRRMLQVAVERQIIARNPATLVRPPKVPPSELRWYDAVQLQALAEAIAPRYRALVLVGGWGGLRWSEMVGLRRAAVDGPRVTVLEQLVRRDGGWDRRPPKSEASRRVVTLPGWVADELAGHLDEWAADGPDGLVFPNQLGSPVNGPSFRGNVWVRAIDRAGLPRVRVHDLRHTAVALAIEAGAHPKAIQARMGHASISVTLDRYGHLFPDSDAGVAEALEGLRPPS